MNIRRKLFFALLVAGSTTLVGCKSGSMFGFGKSSPTVASSAPDVGKANYNGLSQQFTSSGTAVGGNTSGNVGLGGSKPPSSDNFIVAGWKKTTSAVSGAFSSKPNGDVTEDPVSLSTKPKKVGPDVYVAAARLLENQGKFEEAQAQYDKALKVSPKDLNTLVSLARMYDRQGQSAKAVELYRKAIAAHPESGMAYNDLGLCYARQKDLPQSMANLHKAVELQPANVKYRNNLATVQVEAGRADEAIKTLSAVNPQAVAHYNVGYLLEQKGNAQGAAQHMARAVELDPSMQAAREMLAKLEGSMSEGQLPVAQMQQQAAAMMARAPQYQAYQPQQSSAPVYQPAPAAASGTTYSPAPYQMAPPTIEGAPYSSNFSGASYAQPSYEGQQQSHEEEVAPELEEPTSSEPAKSIPIPSFHISDDDAASESQADDEAPVASDE
ncbi:Tetratricopeptide TPR_2 repeat protein [Pirellula staleyi DSM 6068]|uniref:Tetratricopeptide TPR_2 repeat protein n=1 Tax=Pirellula staleyi (strain ATCC 27377 / DSM 6068 / ICPB 4128) TaxID=530564 RepID=D2R2K3_PIRSD|nr:tetratricopeptide repeat protein [Pirellula staleyi]ADB16843.1 Tetratricopeptide TPR_2 repeat protein [Pirellula staleyi DSM 6068]